MIFTLKNLVKTISCFPLLVGLNAVADPILKIERAVQIAVNDQMKMSNFLNRYGLDIVQEQNYSQKGQLNGSVEGHLGGLSLGSLPLLASGIAQVGSSLPVTTNPFSNFGEGLSPFSTVLSGLGGMGALFGSMHGQIIGSVEATGTKYNDEAHAFLVFGKSSSVLLQVDKVVEQAKHAGAQIDNEVVRLRAALQNPYLVNEEEVIQFNQLKDDLNTQLEQIKSLAVSNEMIASIRQSAGNFNAYTSLMEQQKEIYDWAKDKRVSFAIVAKIFQPKLALKSRVCVDPKKLYDKKNTCYIDGSLYSNYSNCIEVDPTNWQQSVYKTGWEVTCNNTSQYSKMVTTIFMPKYNIPLHQVFTVESTILKIISINGEILNELFNKENLATTEERLSF